MTPKQRKRLAKQPIVWRGDLSDDCTATWAGLMLRAEWMNEDYWWWAVYDMQKGEATIDDSTNYTDRFIGGEASRQKAESVAQLYLTEITTRQETARYIIADAFKITGRGFVLAGYITEGRVAIGNTIEFIAYSVLFRRRITGIEGIRKNPLDEVNTGLLIKCDVDTEFDSLRNWKPNNFLAIIYT